MPISNKIPCPHCGAPTTLQYVHEETTNSYRRTRHCPTHGNLETQPKKPLPREA